MFEDNLYNFIKICLLLVSVVHVVFATLLYLQVNRYTRILVLHDNKFIIIAKKIYMLIVLLSSLIIMFVT